MLRNELTWFEEGSFRPVVWRETDPMCKEGVGKDTEQRADISNAVWR